MSSFSDSSSSTLRRALFSLPATLMRGASTKPMPMLSISRFPSPVASIRARIPTKLESFMRFKPSATIFLFSSTRGTASATVPRATISSPGFSAGTFFMASHRAWHSLKAMPTPASSPQGYFESCLWASITATAGGSSSPGRWWSVTTKSMQSCICLSSSTDLMPQSTVITRLVP